MAIVVAAALLVVPAYAQIRQFDIPAGDVGKSLPELARQAGIQVLAPGDLLEGHITPAIHGSYDVVAALALLLKGTDLSAKRLSGGIFMITAPGVPKSETWDAPPAPPDPVPMVETIVVSGYRASLASAVSSKRAETAAIDSIFSEDIGKFPDSNLAEAMQRIPGIALSRGDGGEGKQISVRGLGPGFTRVRLNGMEGASSTGSSDIYGAGSSGRAFDFNVFPTEIFSSLTVRKTPSPDVIEGSLGATVDLRAPQPFDMVDDFVISATARSTFQEVGGATSPRISLLVSKKFGNGHFGILGSLSYQHRKTLEVGYAAVDVLPTYVNGGLCSPIGWTGAENPSSSSATAALKGITATMCSTGNPRTSTIAAYSKIMSLTGKSGIPGGGVFLPRLPRYVNSQATSDRIGATLSLQWKPDENTDLLLDLLSARYGQRRYDSYIAGLSFARNINNNGQPMVSVRDIAVEPGGSLIYGLFDGVDVRSENLDDRWSSSVKMANLSFNRAMSDRFGIEAYAGFYEDVFDSPWRLQTVIDAVDTDNFSIDFRGRGDGSRRGALTPKITFGFDVADPANFAYAPGLADGTVTGFFNTQARPSNVTAINKNFELRGGYQVADGWKLTAGASFRVNSWHNWSSATVPSQTATLALPPGISLAQISRHVRHSDQYWSGAPADWVQLDQRKFLQAFDYHLQYCRTECGQPDSTVRETITALYAMTDIDFTLFGFSVRGDGGVRYVHTDQRAVGYVPVDASAEYEAATGFTSIGERRLVDRSYENWLPSANLVVDLMADVLARFSAARVMTRPELGYLVPGAGVTTSTRAGSVNNPYLNPIVADTVDIGFEWYFRPGSLLSVAYFHKDMKSYIQRVTSYVPYSYLGLPNSLLDNTASVPSDLFNVSRYVNSGGGLLDGVEFYTEVPLTFLQGFWGGFGVQANYTFVASKVNYILASANGVPTQTTINDLLMLSPHTGSGVIYWENDRFSVRLTGNYRSNYIRGIPASQDSDLQGNRSTFYLDGSSSYQVSDCAKLLIEVSNITDEQSILHVDSRRKDTLFALRDGRTISAGISLKF